MVHIIWVGPYDMGSFQIREFAQTCSRGLAAPKIAEERSCSPTGAGLVLGFN